jgi:hypothetical protein
MLLPFVETVTIDLREEREDWSLEVREARRGGVLDVVR